MDFEAKLKSMAVGDFMVTLEDSPRHDFGPYSINRRVCGLLRHYQNGSWVEPTMWDVVVDGPAKWRLAAGCGPKIIDALARAINIELGAPIVSTAVPTKEKRDEGYFWTKERLAEAAQMLAKGGSYRTVALHYGKSVDGMKAALKRYGLYQPRFNGSWHPIETAPKDGTNILVTDGKITVLGWHDEFDESEEPWCGFVKWPTHWMPLPPPPK